MNVSTIADGTRSGNANKGVAPRVSSINLSITVTNRSALFYIAPNAAKDRFCHLDGVFILKIDRGGFDSPPALLLNLDLSSLTYA